jgi:hypothetical protein
MQLCNGVLCGLVAVTPCECLPAAAGQRRASPPPQGTAHSLPGAACVWNQQMPTLGSPLLASHWQQARTHAAPLRPLTPEPATPTPPQALASLTPGQGSSSPSWAPAPSSSWTGSCSSCAWTTSSLRCPCTSAAAWSGHCLWDFLRGKSTSLSSTARSPGVSVDSRWGRVRAGGRLHWAGLRAGLLLGTGPAALAHSPRVAAALGGAMLPCLAGSWWAT